MIAGYYDSGPEHIREWLTSAGKFSNIDGVMYTTWHNKYADLEAFSQFVDAFQPKPSNPAKDASSQSGFPGEPAGEQPLPPPDDLDRHP